MKILSYNLRHHRAAAELEALAAEHRPDVLCLQEAHAADVPRRIGHLERAATTSTGLLGLAVLVDASRFAVVGSRSFRLKPGLHDVVFLPGTERLLAVRLVDRLTGEGAVVASFHAAPLTATNILRRHQVSAAHMLLDEIGEGDPALLIGDFNYPLFHGGLRRTASADGYDVSIADAPTYRHLRRVSTHFDLVTSRGLDVASVRTLPEGASDHRPILAETVDARSGLGAPSRAARSQTVGGSAPNP